MLPGFNKTGGEGLVTETGDETRSVSTIAEGEETPHLSIVIPMYNETGRIQDTIPVLLAYFERQSYSYEFVIVDDGSADGTPALARELFAEVPQARILEKKPNRGKGSAIKAGMLAARGDYVHFCDADLSTPPEELEKFWQWVDEGYDIVIGSRKMAGANITRHQPLWRESLGKVFTWLTNRLATRGISDVTCGFKLFTRKAAHDLFARSRIRDWSFDAEVLFIAQRRGYSIKEVPVTWHDTPGTKVRIVRDAVNALRGLAKIRLNSMRGRYK
jgi:dolichyl-phosphate beta-glucosyltransferase